MNLNHLHLLEILQKAVSTGTLDSIVPEDLEVEAHNTLWDETDPEQLTILKLLPTTPATQIEHKFSRITSYGNQRDSGFFGEQSLPPETNFAGDKLSVNLRLIGEIGPTFLLASLEKTNKALGTEGAQNVERTALRRNLLLKKAKAIYFADTRATRLGTASLRFKGLAQLIEEGTNGTTGDASPYGTHVIDMLGQPLTVNNIRSRTARAITMFGRFNCLTMDPLVRGDLEGSMDAAHRLDLPISAQPYMIGQNIGGIRTQGGIVYFDTDNTLTPMHSRPQYSASVGRGAPTTVPTVTATAQADNATTDTVTSLWDAASAGNIFWVVTETVDEVEGLGVRVPASGYTAVAAGQEVDLNIRPGNPLADSFKVYRGNEDDGGLATDAWFIFEVANSGGGAAVHAFDNNLYRPNTSWAFGLAITSSSERALHSGREDAYESARAKSSTFLKGNDRPDRNTVAFAELGPSMGVMALAAVLAQVDRPLLYSAGAPICRNARQNIVFKNIGLR